MARRPFWRIVIGFAVVALLAPTSASQATTRLGITVLGGTSDSPGMADGEAYFESMFSSGPSMSFGESSNSGDGSSLASGSVGFGWARSLSTANHSTLDDGIPGTSNASTQSLFRDDLTITAPGMSGSGTVTFLIDVSGGVTASSSAESASVNSEADWSAFVRSSTAPSEAGRIGEGGIFVGFDGVFPTGDLMGGMYAWGPIPFNFGVPFEITVALNALVDVNFCCSAAANFGSTLQWLGVVELVDGGGTPVADFEIASGSGADYGEAIPVPEPASAALALVSLVTTVLLAGIRRSS
jgi:hypothetical protein